MTRFFTLLHHRSLTFSLMALLFGLAALAHIFDFSRRAHMHGHEFVQQSVVLCVVALVVCTAVFVNLVLDVKRGYSPSRCSLASVIMLLASAGPVLLAVTLIAYFSR